MFLDYVMKEYEKADGIYKDAPKEMIFKLLEHPENDGIYLWLFLRYLHNNEYRYFKIYPFLIYLH